MSVSLQQGIKELREGCWRPSSLLMDYLCMKVVKSPSEHRVLQGGLLLMGAGLAAAAAREAWHHLWEWAKRRLLVRCQLDSRDDTYR